MDDETVSNAAPIPTDGHPDVTPLTLSRAPGPLGLTLRCQGDLTFATVESLRRELGLITHGRPQRLVVDISAVCRLDDAGLRALSETAREMEAAGGHLEVLAGTGAAWCTLADAAGPKFALAPVD
jgi:ABC-type transporter Mla MlaB component